MAPIDTQAAVPPGLDADEAPAAVARHLARRGHAALEALGPGGLLEAWCTAITNLRDPASDLGSQLRHALAPASGLSPAGLDAALEVVLGGTDRRQTEALLGAARARPRASGLAVIIVASNVPGLAVQPILPALALGRPVLVKSARTEPIFAPAFVRALGYNAPSLRQAVSAVTWRGGDRAVEDAVFGHAARVLAYGDGDTIADLEARLGSRLVAFGPKLSLAIIGRAVDPVSVAADLARDIALLDQRGCLSIQAIYTAGNAEALASHLAEALEQRALAWPPGIADAASAARVQRLRASAVMNSCFLAAGDLTHGTVVVEPDPSLRPSPGLRSVRIHPVRNLIELPTILAPWHGRLQGVALAGEDAWALGAVLEDLGISRLAGPGDLQRVDTSWRNGSLGPLDALA